MRPKSYDIIGSKEKAVAIVEISDELKDQEKEIAEEILKTHKNVKSVLKKTSERKGVFRTRNYEFLLGDKNTEVIHIEHGCKLKLDPQKVYFSSREGTERLRISGIVKPKETILVMFAGIGPYPIMIAKKQPKVKKIISIEINPMAVEYMKENIRLNRIGDKVIPVLGNVKEGCKEWFGKCDRVIMPLPQDAWNFFDIAYKCLKKKGGFIHLYTIEKENIVEDETKKTINTLKKKINRKIKFNIRKVLPYSPRTNKYCIDLEIS
ncbi:MAG: class I SAM-dependent methyltransferase family protein [Candidatus Aenigmarchaeota archaeon]|nr:class I SAM-dependent methyltransferase family protein [Candidatus Aenigmarchaeota archaeon]